MSNVTCSQQNEQKGHPIGIARVVGLDTAAKMLGGQVHLADALDITTRALAYKLNAERGISNGDLMSAAMALEHRAARLVGHAIKLRAETGLPEPAPAPMEVL